MTSLVESHSFVQVKSEFGAYGHRFRGCDWQAPSLQYMPADILVIISTFCYGAFVGGRADKVRFFFDCNEQLAVNEEAKLYCGLMTEAFTVSALARALTLDDAQNVFLRYYGLDQVEAMWAAENAVRYDLDTICTEERANYWHRLGYYRECTVNLPTEGHVLESRRLELLGEKLRKREIIMLAHQVRRAQMLTVSLKTFFYSWFFSSGADALALPGGVPTRGQLYYEEVRSLYMVVAQLYDRVGFCLACWYQGCSDWVVSYGSAPTPLVVKVEMWVLWPCAAVLLYTLVKSWYAAHNPVFKVKEAVKEEGTSWKAEHMSPEGTVIEIVHNGELISVTRPNLSKKYAEEENALPGSTLFPCRAQNVGAIMVCNESVELTVAGCFWRFEDYLITARHNAQIVDMGTADVYLVGFDKEGKVCKVDPKKIYKVEDGFFSDESNLFAGELDVFARRVPKGVWTKTQVHTSKTKKNSAYNQIVSALGFSNNVLMTSAGRTLPGSGPAELYHTATTLKGFSGAPLLSGSFVVGMHIQGAHDKNVAIRIEPIMHQLKSLNEASDFTSSSPDHERSHHKFKLNGESVKWHQHEDEYVAEYHDGRVSWGYTREDVEREDPDYFRDREQEEDARDRAWAPSKRRTTHTLDFQDETALEVQKGSCVAAVVQAELPKAQIRGDVYVVDEQAAVHVAAISPVQAVSSGYLDGQQEKLVSLGYDPSKYVWPDISRKTEEESCRKHLELFAERNKLVKTVPSEDEIKKLRFVMAELLKFNRFEPSVAYKQPATIKRIINSSAFKESKSPGFPYQADGLATNGNVLKAFTTDGLAELVIREWDQEFDLKVFLKGEPTKVAKIEKGMPRVITGFPAHKMLKHMAIFEDLQAAAVENWTKSPLVAGFAPSVGGHIQELASRFGDRKVYASDKVNWDYTCFGYVFDLVEDVIIDLAVQTDEWTDDAWADYEADIRAAIREVSRGSRYRCSNGKVYATKFNGAMKSGWYLTYLVNSMAQGIVDVLIKLRMGVVPAAMLEPDHHTTFGGDDVLQTFPKGFDTKKYIETASEFGFELTEFEVCDTFDGCEFFSHTFKKAGRQWTYHPTRFAKHIESLRRVKLEDLAGALASHMRNHVWNDERFNFFRRMYGALRKEHPVLFPVDLCPKQEHLRWAVLGLE